MPTEEEILEMLRTSRENPFPYPEPKDFIRHILIGRNEQLESFKEIFSTCCSNSIMAIMHGAPSFGKSQFVNHLNYLINEMDLFGSKSFMLKFISLDKIYESKDYCKILLEKIKESNSLQNLQREFTDSLDREEKGKVRNYFSNRIHYDDLDNPLLLLNSFISFVRENEPNFGFCFAIDNVDEHLRFLKRRDCNTGDFFSPLRMLLSGVTEGLLILLACTSDVAFEINDEISHDRTYGRRLFWIKPELKELTFEHLNNLVTEYLKAWYSLEDIPLNANSEMFIPFSTEAINLFSKASKGVPGAFVAFCNRAVEKLKRNLQIYMIDAFSAYKVIESLAETHEITDNELTTLENKARSLMESIPEVIEFPQFTVDQIENWKDIGATRFPSIQEDEIENVFLDALDTYGIQVLHLPPIEDLDENELTPYIINLHGFKVAVQFFVNEDGKPRKVRLRITKKIVSILKENIADYGVIICCNNSIPEFETRSPKISSKKLVERFKFENKIILYSIPQETLFTLLAFSEVPDEEQKEIAKIVGIHFAENIPIKPFSSFRKMKYKLPPEDITLVNIQTLLTLKIREGTVIDYKSKYPRALSEHIVAFANTEGGHIVFGIEDEYSLPKEIVGIRNNDLDMILRSFVDIYPDLDLTDCLWEFEIPNTGGKKIAVLFVPKHPNKKLHWSTGKVFIRVGNQKKPLLDPSKIDELREKIED